MPALPFMKRTKSSGEDKYTRDDAPRTRPRPRTTEQEKRKDNSATPATNNNSRQRRRLSMTSTILALNPREWRTRLPAAFNVARFVVYGMSQIISVCENCV
jgi:hypothetical protein